MALPFQTGTIAEFPDSYMVGQIINPHEAEVMTARCPSDGIAPGVIVVIDAADTPGQGEPRAFKLPASAADITEATVWGILALDDTYENDNTGTFVYDTDDLVPVVTHGQVAIEPEDALTAGVSPFVRHAAGGGGSTLGALRSDADTATATQLANLRTLTPSDSGTPGVLEIR